MKPCQPVATRLIFGVFSHVFNVLHIPCVPTWGLLETCSHAHSNKLIRQLSAVFSRKMFEEGALGPHGALVFASKYQARRRVAQQEDASLCSGDTQGLGPDAVLVVDGARSMHTDTYRLGAPMPVVLAAVAAPNRQVEAVRNTPKEVLEEALVRRLRTAFDARVDRCVGAASTGAIGCGAFRWNGEDSACRIARALEASRWLGRLLLTMSEPALASCSAGR